MITQNDKNFFLELLGRNNAFFDTPHKLAYSFDATRNKFLPDAVLFANNEEEISKILKYCNKFKIPVTPRGAGSGFSGGSLAINGGIVLSLEKMNKIIEIDEKNMTATLQPGVINLDLQNAASKVGLFYPPDPASEGFCTIGGNINENSGGMRAVKYGVTKDYVMQLKAVLPNGEIITAGRKTIKDVAGYNIAGILIASEGTLAVISEITLKLIPKPKIKKTIFASFNDIKNTMNSVYESLYLGAKPSSLEFLDELSIKAVEQKFKIGLNNDAKGLLIADIDGNLDDEIKYQINILQDVCKKNNCLEFKISQNEEESKNLWFARKNCSQSMNIYGSLKLNEDIAVPRSNLAKYLEKIEEISNKYNVKIPCFGHAGDGNVHTNVMTDKNNKICVENAHKAVDEIFKVVIELNGSITGEHGIGISKAKYMKKAFSKAELELFKNIKKAFDPNNILNPNKMGIFYEAD